MTAMRRAAPFLLALIAGCATAPRAVDPPSLPFGPQHVEIYVVSHGWHTGLVVPAAPLNSDFPELQNRFGTPAFYEMGWGDKGFYQAQEITVGLALRAMFWSPGAVMHIAAVPASPYESFPHSTVARLCLSESQLGTLRAFLAASLVRSDGRLMPLSRGIYGDSQFYEAIGTYHMFNTCNKWTAKALSSAGLPISPELRLTASSVMSALEDQELASCGVSSPSEELQPTK